MAEDRDLIYLYDGSFDGLMCCVFESFSAKEIPAAVFSPDTFQYTLYPIKEIVTDREKARRVHASIERRIGPAARELVESGYLTCVPDRELLVIRFLHLGYRAGPRVVDWMQNETVCALTKAVRFLYNESHLLKEFLRFSEVPGGGLAAAVSPKNIVLPALLRHFADRLCEEHFLIYDRTHQMAAVYRPYEGKIIPAESFEMAQVDGREQDYRRLWRRFYDTIAIEGRYNPKCRMTHCPKRYWENMTEFAAAPEGGRPPLGAAAVKQLPTAMGR